MLNSRPGAGTPVTVRAVQKLEQASVGVGLERPTESLFDPPMAQNFAEGMGPVTGHDQEHLLAKVSPPWANMGDGDLPQLPLQTTPPTLQNGGKWAPWARISMKFYTRLTPCRWGLAVC